jgi:Ser/Thr protein kinase RdoA (MazF antagonist)
MAVMAEPEALRTHLLDQYGFRARTLFTFDQDVVLLRRDDGPNWVARVFPARRPGTAVAGDAEILSWLAAQGYPAERTADPDPVTALGDETVLVTEAVSVVPRVQRRAAIKDSGGIRGLGALLGKLHTLAGAGADAAPNRPGGAWHHLADGLPAAELDAARALVDRTMERAPTRDLAQIAHLADALDAADDCDGLPEAFIHPDFVLANVVATAEPGMVLVDWAGAGRGPRLWSLAFLLWAEGNKDLRRVDLALSGYRRHVELSGAELERLEAAIIARPLVFEAWSLHNHARPQGDTALRVREIWRLAHAIAERARQTLTGAG